MNEQILQFPTDLAEVSAPFGELAKKIVNNLPRCPERTVALRKDAAVRAKVYKEDEEAW